MGDWLYGMAKRGLFRLPAERAHEVTLSLLMRAHRRKILERLYPASAENHRPVETMGLSFPNVLGLAAGMDKTGAAVDGFGALGFGHVEVGTVTPRPQSGNERPRLFRLPEQEAIINRMGFNNPGLDRVLANLERSTTFSGIVGLNLGKNFDTPNDAAVDDYREGLRAGYGVADYFTINLSSPNTKGLRDLQAVEACEELLRALLDTRDELREETGLQRPLAVKLAPDLGEPQVKELADMLAAIGVDAVIVTNTTVDRSAVAGHSRSSEVGGLSGAPLRERSRECLRQWRSHLDRSVPVISVGGILDGETAVERLQAGASLLQIYTGLIYRGPGLVREILEAAADHFDAASPAVSDARNPPEPGTPASDGGN